MKKLLLVIFTSFYTLTSIAQPAGMLDETFNLKHIYKNGVSYYTPNGENTNLTIYKVAGDYVLDADGIFNTLNAAASFNSNSLTFNNYGVTLQDCVESNCYFEDLYFYEILTNQNLESKTFTYYYNENNSYKYLRLKDSENNLAYFSTEPASEPDPLLFQTWYLFMSEGDMGEPIFYPGPNPPQITINPDFTYTGIEDCVLITGDFILGNGDGNYDFILQSRNYGADETNCPPGPVDYAMWELQSDFPLGSTIYEGNNGIDYFQFETYPGFISYFQNVLLSTPENDLSDLKIFPNPARNKLTIQSSISNFDFVSITDINGRIINSIKDMVPNEIDVSPLKAGIYFLNIQSSQGKVTKKFIKD